MSIRFVCSHCGHKMTADEFVAGTSITCDACHNLTLIPGQEREHKTPRLKMSKRQHQDHEKVADDWKYCPVCKSPADPLAKVCTSCSFNFVTGQGVSGKKHASTALGSLLRNTLWLVARIVVLGLLVVVGFGGYVLFQKARYHQEIRKALEDGALSVAAEDYHKLAAWYRWAEYLHRPNPYDLRSRQFRAREGKTYQNARSHYFPLLVDKSVWGNRSQFAMKTAWIRFRFANLSKQSINISRDMFLLIGLDNNLSFADTFQKSDPNPLTLNSGEAIQGSLYFGGMFKPPAFLEFNNGGLVVRGPVYVNYAMDNYERDNLDWPAGRGADEFLFLKKWDESKLEAKAVHVLWADFSKLPPPPAEPYTTVLKETNPR